MDYLLEISRIIDGALKTDRPKVVGYVQQLVRKLKDAGDSKAATRLERTLGNLESSELALSRALAPSRLPVDQDSRLPLGDEEWIDKNATPVILEPGIAERVDEFLTFVRHADRLIASGVGLSPSMILYGPPGVGKTQLARSIAGRLGLPLITCRSDSLISSFLGNTARNLRVLFDHARSRPCVLFLDEIDSLAKLRDDQHEMGELKRVVVSLLQNIDALHEETILIAATNHHHLLDPAIWRRFAYRIEVPMPSPAARKEMLSTFLGGDHAAEHLDDLADLSDGMSGSDIRQCCNSAIRSALVRGDDNPTIDDVVRALLRARVGEALSFADADHISIRAARDLAPRLMTCKRLATLFGTSEPTISRRLKAAGESHGEQRRA